MLQAHINNQAGRNVNSTAQETVEIITYLGSVVDSVDRSEFDIKARSDDGNNLENKNHHTEYKD